MTLSAWVLSAVCLVTLSAAQSVGPVTLVPKYTPGARLKYAIAIHSSIGVDATLETKAEAEMDIQPGATPENFEAVLRFTRYHTQVHADAAEQSALAAQTKASDQAATQMKPVRVKVTPTSFTVESRSPGTEYDQAVTMLTELARIDTLPTGAVKVGDTWTRNRQQTVPMMNAAVALKMDCALTGVGDFDGVPSATVTVNSSGSTQLPPGALPGSKQMEAQGLVPEGTLTFQTQATSKYRLADAVLEQATSQTHNTILIKFIGPTPNTRTTQTDIHSSATVTLEK